MQLSAPPAAPNARYPALVPSLAPRLRPFAVALAFVLAFSALIATQNFGAVRRAGGSYTWIQLFGAELPVWAAWAVAAPAIAALSRRFPLPGRPLHLLAHLLAAPTTIYLVVALALAGRLAFGTIFAELEDGYVATVNDTFLRYLAVFLPFYALVVVGERALAHARRAREREVAAARLETMWQRARLDGLRSQLQPHFLFNALHAISALMARDVPAARKMIARLSDLLRLSLAEGGDHEIELARELEMVRTYADLQRLRFGDRLSVDIRVPAEAERLRVPRLILQPLVENAIQHGLEAKPGPFRVRVEALPEPGRLELRVSDDGPGFPAALAEGIGLSNTRERLGALYGGQGALTLRNGPGGGAEVRLTLPRVERKVEVPA